MTRYLETYFRHPLLYLLPLLVLLGGSAVLAYREMRAATPYTAEATIAVNLDPTRERPVGERPVAQQYAELLGELLETDEFVLGVLAQTTPEASLQPEGDRVVLARALRARWKQTALGPNTLKVSFRCQEPEFCTQYMTAMLQTFRGQVAEARLARLRAAVEFYKQQVHTAEERLRATPEGQPEREGVRQTYEAMQTRLIDAQLEEALETQSREQGFQLISPPHVPSGPSSRVREAALPLAAGALLGLVLSVGLVAFSTWTDRTVRSK